MSRTRKVLTIVMLGAMGSIIGATTASAGGGGHCAPTEAHGTAVEMADACFTPTTLHADPGENITFTNRDSFVHNVTANGWGQFEDMSRGDRFTMSFADEGVYAYACTYHPGMTGSIVVGGSGSGAAGEPAPVAASAVPTSGGDGWIGAGAIGLVLGAAAGTGLTAWRRRSPA